LGASTSAHIVVASATFFSLDVAEAFVRHDVVVSFIADDVGNSAVEVILLVEATDGGDVVGFLRLLLHGAGARVEEIEGRDGDGAADSGRGSSGGFASENVNLSELEGEGLAALDTILQANLLLDVHLLGKGALAAVDIKALLLVKVENHLAVKVES
jgi:hypothetical protein